MVYNALMATTLLERIEGMRPTSGERKGMKVGKLAKRTGVSVRTLHYYDEIGLLSPSYYTDVGHRLYSDGDIARLQQIMSLRQLGFSLEEIGDCLNSPGFSPQRVLELHIRRLREQVGRQERLCRRLEAVADSLRHAEEVSVEEFIQTIEEIKMVEKNFTPEQMEYIKQRGEIVGEARIREVEAEWPRLIAEVRDQMDKGTDPADERAQELAKRWGGLVNEFTGGDAGIERVLRAKYEDDPTFGRPDMDPRMGEYMEYVNRAMGASKRQD